MKTGANFIIFVLFVLILDLSPTNGLSVLEKKCQSPEYTNCKHISSENELWCDDSNVTIIPDPDTIQEGFSPAKYTEHLYMNRSCMRFINTENLLKFTCLKQLYLDENFLAKLNPSQFSRCNKLRVLSLSKNLLTNVNSDAFRGLQNLEVLSLNGNNLTLLNENSFQHLRKLRVLNLAGNNLRRIHKRTFLDLMFLEELDLSENHIAHFKYDYLRGLAQLRVLNLRGNSVKFVNWLSFVSTPRLQKVDLRNNSITCLNENIFNKTEVSFLLISGNRLTTPKPNWFRKMARKPDNGLRHFVSLMGGNHWKCGCNAIPYLDFLHKEIGDLEEMVSILDVECSHPPQLRGMMLSTLTLKQIEASENKTCERRIVNQAQKCSDHVEKSSRKAFKITTTSPITSTEKTNQQTSKLSLVLSSEYNVFIALAVAFVLSLLIVIMVCCAIMKRRSENEAKDLSDFQPPRNNHDDVIFHPCCRHSGSILSNGYYSIPDLHSRTWPSMTSSNLHQPPFLHTQATSDARLLYFNLNPEQNGR